MMQAVIFDLDHTLLTAEEAVHEGTHELMAILKRLGFKLAGITNGDHRVIVRLEELGLRHHFATVLCADQIPAPKVTMGIDYLLDMLGVDKAETALVSHAYSDILLGHDAQLGKTVAVSHGSDNDKVMKRAGASHVVADMPGVLDVIS